MELESDQSEESILPRESSRKSRGARRQSETEHELREKLLKQVQERRKTKILAKPEAFNVGAVPILPISPQIAGIPEISHIPFPPPFPSPQNAFPVRKERSTSFEPVTTTPVIARPATSQTPPPTLLTLVDPNRDIIPENRPNSAPPPTENLPNDGPVDPEPENYDPDVGPELPENILRSDPIRSDLPSNHRGHLLPLHQPVVLQMSSDESDSENNPEDDLDDLDRGKKRIHKLKELMRREKLKIEASKRNMTDIRAAKKRKFAERAVVKGIRCIIIEKNFRVFFFVYIFIPPLYKMP